MHRTDVELVIALSALFVAARLLVAVPWWMVVAMLVVAVVTIRPRLLLVALLLCIGARSGGVLEAMEPIETKPVDHIGITLTSDPRETLSGWSSEADLDGERVYLQVQFVAGLSISEVAVGDELVISGSQRGQSPESTWEISRKIVGSVSATTIHRHRPASGLHGLANGLRQLYRSGVSHMSTDEQALFTGLVFGDDRDQSPVVADSFRAAGLGHLLAVSGQNVVFVLLLASPLISRIPNVWLGVVASLLVLYLFGLLTRFEASVLRALVMAGFVLVANGVGRRVNAGLALTPAVAALLVIEPLLAWSLAFQLSVAATAGMVVLAPRLSEVLWGPEWLRLASAATLGAQLFVAPLVLTTFGRLSVVALPANVLAGPAAVGVMMWGLIAGVVAGVVPGGLAEILHAPTQLMLWWVRAVADTFASLDVGRFSGLHLVISAGGMLVLIVASQPMARRIGGIGIALALTTVVVFPHPLPAGVHQISNGLTVARSTIGHDVVILEPGAQVDEVIEGLRTARIGRIDLLIANGNGREFGRLVFAISQRSEITTIWAPTGHNVPDAVVRTEMVGSVGQLQIAQDAVTGEVVVVELARN